MTAEPMQDLPRGARFVHDHNEHVITTPASEHRNGWVDVVNVTTGEPGFFSYAAPVDVEVLSW